MNFRTEIVPVKSIYRIDYDTGCAFVGSCFSDEIGKRMSDDMFDIAANPFGPLYNPESIASALERMIEGRKFVEDELFFSEGKYHSFERHSCFSQPDATKMAVDLNSNLEATRDYISRCQYLFVTFGSAIGFEEKANQRIVANCHKLSSQRFNRVELKIDTIVKRWSLMLKKLKTFNSDLKIVFTVSPIRHIGYGLVADRLSKSRLIVACHQLSGEPDVVYFPSYELLTDDLRDYRFYSADMVHPSDIAVDYIYDFFRATFMDKNVVEMADKWRKITLRCKHRFTEESEEKQIFINKTMDMAHQLASSLQNKTAIIERFTNYMKQWQ